MAKKKKTSSPSSSSFVVEEEGEEKKTDIAESCYLSKGLVTSVVGARASPNTVASWTLM